LLSKDEARRIAANIARLPALFAEAVIRSGNCSSARRTTMLVSRALKRMPARLRMSRLGNLTPADAPLSRRKICSNNRDHLLRSWCPHISRGGMTNGYLYRSVRLMAADLPQVLLTLTLVAQVERRLRVKKSPGTGQLYRGSLVRGGNIFGARQ
jgi:hypothetical protein